MKNLIGILALSAILLASLLSCSRERTPTAPASNPSAIGGLILNVSDSYHLSDSTANWSALVKYRLDEGVVPFDSGDVLIPDSSQLGSIYSKTVNSLPSGGFTANFIVQRPFVILERKDDIGKARFIESIPVTVPQYAFNQVPLVDIWAYRPYRLIVFFNDGVSSSQADSIINTFGVQILSRNQTFVDSAWFYNISTDGVGFESDLKPLIENAPGVRSIDFDVYGHSYF